MDKNFFRLKRVKTALFYMLVLVIPVISSCKNETADTGDLLSTVPSSAGIVAGFNVKAVLEKAGCKVDGAEITPGKELSEWIDNQKDLRDSNLKAMKLILNGESGVDPKVAVYFTDAYNSYLTAMLSDTRRFENFVESQSGEKFETAEKDVRTCGNVAVKGAQAWICVSSNNTIDSKAIANYASLGESQSFLNNGFSAKIANMTSDIVGWGEIKSLSKQGFSFRELSSMNLIAGMLFEDASSVSFSVDFQKGKAAGALTVLNSKGEVAKYLLPASKIDLQTVKSVAKNAELVAAMTITKDFTKKIEKMSSSFGGNMFGMFTEAMKPIDGTVAVACGDLNNPESSLSGVITTDGNPSRDLLSMLGNFGDIKTEGKMVRIDKGTVGGSLDVEKDCGSMKGSIFGVVVNLRASVADKDSMFKTFALSLVPDGNGIRCDIILESVDDSKNMLLSLIEESSKGK